jgi:protein-serine/threonine kinase
MQQLLCEPEDRIGSQTASSTTRPDSLIMQNRRSGFINSFGGPLSVDGADIIKVAFFLPLIGYR